MFIFLSISSIFSDINTCSSTDWPIVNENYFESQTKPDENLHICKKCIELDIQLQKAKFTITKLQKRCVQKAAEIDRIKAAEKRLRLSKCTLEEMLRHLKEEKLISEDGQSVLNVINS